MGKSTTTVTKADLVTGLNQKTGLSKKDSSRIVERILEIIKSNLEKGEKVKISSFGCFEVKHKRARKGRNPQTGEAITLPARKVVTFKPSQGLREGVKGA